MRDFGERRRLVAAAACLATCEKVRIDCLAASILSAASTESIPGRGVLSCELSANVVSYSSSVNLGSPSFFIVSMVVVILCSFVCVIAVISLNLEKYFNFFRTSAFTSCS